MIHRIHNTFLEVAASDLGAELMSIRSAGGREYLWQGDPAYWKGRSPTIFPYVARLNKGTYLLEGREYHLPIHGFARTSVFALEARTEDSMTFLLESTPELLYDTAWSLLQAPEVLAEMGKNARAKAQPDVLEHIYQTLKSL